MSDEDLEDHLANDSLRGDLQELGEVAGRLFRRLPSAKKAVEKLTGGLVGAGARALGSRLHLYRTGNLVKEAEIVANTSGLPLPMVLNTLIRQRRIDELTVDAVRRIEEKQDERDVGDSEDTGTADRSHTTNRWFETLMQEAGTVDEDDVREAFTRVLANEIESPGACSVKTLRILGAMSRSTAQRFRRAVSVSIRLEVGAQNIMDARIPAVGGTLGQNCLQDDGLSYSVLTDLTENGLVHPDYGSRQPYGPLDVPDKARQQLGSAPQIPFAHQDAMWMLIPKDNSKKATSVRVVGAQLTTCGIELLRVVDVEPLPKFTEKLTGHFSQSGYSMVRFDTPVPR